MTATVRLFAHDGINTLPVASDAGQFRGNSMFVLRQPYLAREKIEADSSTATTSAADLSANSHTKVLRMEIEPGKRCAYEISPPGRNDGTPVDADDSSPVASGDVEFEFGPNYRISLLDVTA
jgi:hypothetical protein